MLPLLIFPQMEKEEREGREAMEKAYREILKRYVAEIDPRKLSDAAIEGMLRELDPYSEYIYDGESHRIDDITTGEYGGVGIHLGRLNDTIIVVAPMDGTPAFLQGMLAGDRIIKIDTTWTHDMRIDEAAKLMRGQVGTAVELTIRRDSEPEPLTFELIREMIKVPDITYSGITEDHVGYIRFSNFTKYSGEDLESTVRKLTKVPLNGLIIDVRGNPGGLLSAALMSADLFIEKGALLLETKGRVDRSDKQYFSRRNPIISEDLPLAILVDGGSASASEILSGILQDYDRAVVIGESTFGKGLVQTITRLSPDTRLKLTTAKYYLPSGRLIQKRDIAENIIYEDVLDTQQNDGYFSENRRKFESGIGVQPDRDIEPLSLSNFERELWRKRLFFKYALDFHAQNPGIALPVEFEDAQVDSFHQWMLKTESFPQTDLRRWINSGNSIVDSSSTAFSALNELQSQLLELESIYQKDVMSENHVQILNGLELEIARVIGGNGARVAASLKYDPVVQQTIDLLNSEREMQDILAGSQENEDY